MRRRHFMGLSLLTPMLFRSRRASAVGPGMAIVLNSADASLSLLDSAGVEMRRVPVLREPHHIVASPSGRDLLVGDSSGNEMLFLDPATAQIKNRMPVADPYHLAFSPDGRWLTVTGIARNQVDVYDAASMQLAHRFAAPTMPSHLCYSPDSSVAYVTLQGSNKLGAYDLKRMQPLWTSDCGRTPAGVLWHKGKLLVANMGSDHFAVLDPTDGSVGQRVRTGRGCHQIFESPDGHTLWVNNRVEGTTVAVDAATLAPGRVYNLGGGPDCIEFAADGRLWITLRFAQKVAVLTPATGDFDTHTVGRSPHGIYLTKPVRA